MKLNLYLVGWIVLVCFKGVLFWFNLTTKVAGGNPRPPALSDNPDEYFHDVTESSFYTIMHSEFHSTQREKRDHTYASFASSGRLQNIQNNGNQKTVRPKSGHYRL